jgi:hypothetical protein
MATQSKKTGFPEFFADTQSAENLRRQFIEAPLEAAGQPALGAGIELANLLSILPGAFVASQERELERIKKSGVDNDPRVAALETSIEQAGVLQTMAQRGQVRIQRGLVAFAGADKVFHGFVSDVELTPLKGLTVRLSSEGRKALSATTDDDGYFSIPLGARSSRQQENSGENKSKAGKGSLLQRITDLMASPGIAPLASAAESVAGQGSQVEILKRGKLLHTDPASLTLDQGSVYREYVIADTEPSSASDAKDSSAGAARAASAKVDQSQATSASEAASPQPAAAATSTETRKNPPRPAKSKKATKK